jgi:hypothetical protein
MGQEPKGESLKLYITKVVIYNIFFTIYNCIEFSGYTGI